MDTDRLPDGIATQAVHDQLRRIVDSDLFRNAGRLRQFLSRTVELTLEGRSGEIKEYLVGTEIFGRPASFNPRLDSVVRVEARRLRARLEEYYQGPGRADPIVISLPKGGYVPQFHLQAGKKPFHRRHVAAAVAALAVGVGWWVTRPPAAPTAALPQAAREAYWRGIYFNDRGTPADYRRAVSEAEAAIAQAPSFAPAHALLATAATQLAFHQWAPRDEVLPKARHAAQQALALDPSLAKAHAARAILSYAFDRDWALAESSFRAALRAEPNAAEIHHWFALALTSRGRHDEAIAEMRHAIELDPARYVADHALGVIYYSARRYDEACRAARSALATNPGHYGSRALLGTCLSALGDYQGAIRQLQEALQMTEPRAFIAGRLGYCFAKLGRRADALRTLHQLEQGRHSLVGWQRVYAAQIYAGLGDFDRAFEVLRQAAAAGDTDMLFTLGEAVWDPMRTDPRFLQLQERTFHRADRTSLRNE